MPRVAFTSHLERHVQCPTGGIAVTGATVRDVLDRVFADHPRVRGYVLDEQGSLRQHVVVFVNGRAVRDRAGLTDPVADDAELYVMQALSGG